MNLFVDSSALYALLDEDDAGHSDVAHWFQSPERASEELITHNYVVVETVSLVQRRLGPALVRRLFDGILPAVSQRFVEEDLHQRAVAAYTAALRRRSSFVDRVSFEFMRDQGIDVAFALDDDFAGEGFTVVP